MITRQLRLHKALARTITLTKNINPPSILSTKPIYKMSSISQYVRKFMNRIRFEDNRAIQPSQQKISIEVLQTPKQVEQKFIGDQQFKSVVEKQRMQKIDQIIGTKTYFHQTKKYQQRLDSDHVQVIDDLAMKYRQPKRQQLNWQNTQAPQQYKVKSTRKFFKNLKNLRQYPKHNYRITSFTDQKSQQNIEFLGKQGLFSKLSLKWVDTYQKSLQNEIIDDKSYELHAYRYSQKYVYFATEYESSKLYRIARQKFTQKLIQSVKVFEQHIEDIQEVISMQEIYDQLKQYFHDERVTQWLKKVQNGEIGYLLSGYRLNENEDSVVVWVDLLGNKKEYVHLYKRLISGGSNSKIMSDDVRVETKLSKDKQQNNQSKQQNQQNTLTTHTPFTQPSTLHHNHLIFNCKPQASFSSYNNKIFLIQRSQQGSFTQLIYVPIQSNHTLGQPQIIYKCKLYEQMDLLEDQGLGYLFLKVKDGRSGECKVYGVEEKLSINDENEQGEIEWVPVDLRDMEQIDVNNTQKQYQPKYQQKPQEITKPTYPSRLSLTSSSQGLIFTNFYPTQQYFKHGPNSEYSTKIYLIPFKSHIQIINESNTRMSSQHLLQGHTINQNQINKRPSIKELDYNNKKVLFQCPQQQFITNISIRQSHTIISLSTLSIYNKQRLLFLPHDTSKNPHSLIFAAQSLHFLNTGYNYTSQLLSFTINRSSLLNQHYQYTIWKKQLKQIVKQEMYLQNVKISQYIQLNVMCLGKYLEYLPKFFNDRSQLDGQQQQGIEQKDNYKLQNSKVPILIYLTDNKTSSSKNNNKNLQSLSLSPIQQTHLRQFLQKGTLIITISCRGTLTSDLLTFYQGSGKNFNNYIEDIQNTIEWIGNNLGTNISLYSKGYISSLVGMLINVRHPFLLTSTVLHDGLYQLVDEKKGLVVDREEVEYFFRLRQLQEQQQKKLQKEQQQQQGKNNKKSQQQQKQQQRQKTIKYWQLFNPAQYLFKRSKLATKKDIQQQPKPKISQQQRQQQQQNQQKQHVQQKIQQLPKIGTLQNILISCSDNQLAKQHSRRMIYHLRKNPHFRYEQVFLKQFLQSEDKELFNLAFIYGKMKERLQLQNMK